MKIRVNRENYITKSWSRNIRRSGNWSNSHAIGSFGREWISRWSENGLSFVADRWIYRSRNWSWGI